MWYLDLYTSQNFTNNKDLFVKELRPQYLNFKTAGDRIFQVKRIGMIIIPISDGSSLKLWDVAYAPDCNSNLISLGQLHDSNITYVDNSEAIILMQAEHPIAYTKCDQKFFVLKLATPNKAMQITRYAQPTYLVSKNRKVRV